jgi:hypothetical protein
MTPRPARAAAEAAAEVAQTSEALGLAVTEMTASWRESPNGKGCRTPTLAAIPTMLEKS